MSSSLWSTQVQHCGAYLIWTKILSLWCDITIPIEEVLARYAIVIKHHKPVVTSASINNPVLKLNLYLPVSQTILSNFLTHISHGNPGVRLMLGGVSYWNNKRV